MPGAVQSRRPAVHCRHHAAAHVTISSIVSVGFWLGTARVDVAAGCSVRDAISSSVLACGATGANDPVSRCLSCNATRNGCSSLPLALGVLSARQMHGLAATTTPCALRPACAPPAPPAARPATAVAPAHMSTAGGAVSNIELVQRNMLAHGLVDGSGGGRVPQQAAATLLGAHGADAVAVPLAVVQHACMG